MENKDHLQWRPLFWPCTWQRPLSRLCSIQFRRRAAAFHSWFCGTDICRMLRMVSSFARRSSRISDENFFDLLETLESGCVGKIQNPIKCRSRRVQWNFCPYDAVYRLISVFIWDDRVNHGMHFMTGSTPAARTTFSMKASTLIDIIRAILWVKSLLDIN